MLFNSYSIYSSNIYIFRVPTGNANVQKETQKYNERSVIFAKKLLTEENLVQKTKSGHLKERAINRTVYVPDQNDQ